MLELMRAMTRYRYIAILLASAVLLQLTIGCVAVSGVIGSGNPTAQVLVSFVTPNPTEGTLIPVPTATPTSTLTPTSTFTPSPTRTPLPSDTPTLTPTSTLLPSATLSPVDTSTPTPQPTPTVRGFTLTVPILMYHYLSEPPPGADAIRRDLSVSPEQFEAHLAYLRQAGYETISFQQLIFALTQESALPEKSIIITFDDGYRDNYNNAFPLLREYSYTATFFIFNQPIDANSADYLTWEMVIEMHKAGMEFGSHSYSHPDLRNRDVDFLVYQILGSKEAIEERTGEPTRFFAYPSGQYDDLTIKVLESANFWAAVTTEWGAEQSYTNRFEMPRIRVRGNDTVKELAEKLEYFK